MKTANISYAKNHLSALLDQVRHGETVLILDRSRPVARLVPPTEGGALVDEEALLTDLERRGILRRGKGKGLAWVLREPPIKVKGAWSAVDAIIEERRSGR